MKKYIVIFCCKNDEHTESVVSNINKGFYNSIVLEREKYGIDWTISTTIKSEQISVSINFQNNKIYDHEINSIYLRRDFTIESQDINGTLTEGEKIYIATQRTIHVNSCIKLLSNKIPTINKPEANYNCLSKVLQLNYALKVGLKVPESFFGGKVDKTDFNFINKLCIKPLEGIHLKEDNKTYAHYSEILEDTTDESLATLDICPAIIQKYINKVYEVRTTIIGEKIFSCMIDSQKSEVGKVDWRHHDWANTPHYAIVLPNDINIKLIKLMKLLGIVYGAVDLIFDGENYYFLEVNSMGQWLWIEDFTEMPISKSISEYLEQDFTK